MAERNQYYPEFIRMETVGTGTYAIYVHKVKYKGRIAAAKVFNPHKDESNFMNEVSMLRELEHAHIIRMFTYGKHKDLYNIKYNCMIIEFADMGSLNQVLNDSSLDYSLEHAIRWLRQCADALAYMHAFKPPKIHRDLKPHNLLLMNGGQTLKICDFGTACDLRDEMTRDKGTIYWTAPELFLFKSYTEKCDVYSFGIIVWQLLARKRPYNDMNERYIWLNVPNKEKPLRPHPIDRCPSIMSLLIERCLEGNSLRRPRMSTIFEMLKSIDSLLIGTDSPVASLVKPEQTRNNESTSSDDLDDFTVCDTKKTTESVVEPFKETIYTGMLRDAFSPTIVSKPDELIVIKSTKSARTNEKESKLKSAKPIFESLRKLFSTTNSKNN